jgi:asparagine synthase (glutamine-hydrolysing)
MCGITGWLNKSTPRKRDLLGEMCGLLAHRGPDYSSHKVFRRSGDGVTDSEEGTIGLGHTRLSIIDLSPDGNQPMADATARYWIVFNGEIYNYRELRKRLHNERGVNFKSNSDTEVLLYSFVYYKEKCLDMLNGIFAFAIFDTKKDELFLARDRLGVKPLYYYTDGGEFVFGSELKPIYRYLNSKIEISDDAVIEYFAQGYIGQTRTIANNIFKVLPAEWLLVDATGKIVKNSYWRIDTGAVAKLEGNRKRETLDGLIESTEEKLLKSVRAQLVSDVPIGAFLSGGIDSSLITAMASKVAPGQLNTFTVGFNEKEFDESRFSKRTAEYLNTEHHEIIFSENDFLKYVDCLPEAYDEPFADSSAIPTMALSQYVRNTITVALSGDGGDEQFHGYTRYDHLKKINMAYFFPQWIRKAARLIFRQEYVGFDFAHKIATMTHRNVFAANANLSNVLPLLGNAFHGKKVYEEHNDETRLALCLDNYLMIHDLNNYMIDDVLVKVDRASMRYGLEVRVPLLDHEVVENSFYSIPLSAKLDYPKKFILKTILSKYLPAEYFERPKMGFGIPLQKWVNMDLRPVIRNALESDSVLYRIFDKAKLRNDFSNTTMANSKFGAEFFWRFFMFLKWEQRYCT